MASEGSEGSSHAVRTTLELRAAAKGFISAQRVEGVVDAEGGAGAGGFGGRASQGQAPNSSALRSPFNFPAPNSAQRMRAGSPPASSTKSAYATGSAAVCGPSPHTILESAARRRTLTVADSTSVRPARCARMGFFAAARRMVMFSAPPKAAVIAVPSPNVSVYMRTGRDTCDLHARASTATLASAP